MRGLLTGKGKVQGSARTKLLTSGGVICPSSVRLIFERAEANLLVVDIKIGKPTLARSAHAFVLAGRAAHLGSVLVVLLRADDAQVSSAVIQAVAVYMVDDHSLWNVAHKSGEALRSLRFNANSVDAWRRRFLMHPEVMGVSERGIFSVEQYFEAGPECDNDEIADLDIGGGATTTDHSRLVGEVVAEIIGELGVDQAIMPSNLVWIGERISGRSAPFPRARGKNARGICGRRGHQAAAGCLRIIKSVSETAPPVAKDILTAKPRDGWR